MKPILRIAFAVSGLLPVLLLLNNPPDPTLLPYSLFVLSVFQRRRAARLARRIPLPPLGRLIVLMIASGLLTEVTAWAGEFLAGSTSPALLHPQLIPDLILASGLYAGWGIAWTIMLHYYRFSLREAFVTAGVFGVVIEQSGAVLLGSLQAFPSDPAGALYWLLFIFVVYGAIVGLAYVPVEKSLARRRRRNHWLKYPAVWLLMLIMGWIVGEFVAFAAGSFGLIPEPRSIRTHPLY